MRCPECNQTFEVLDSSIFDFTSTALGCPLKGHWPKYTARVYIDNVELLRCGCGIAPNVPVFERLQALLFGANPREATQGGPMPIDPYSDRIYMATWDLDSEGWLLSQHQEH